MTVDGGMLSPSGLSALDPERWHDTINGAVLSPDARYRYALWRGGLGGTGLVTFIMLNPSTADGSEDDPTIRRCIGFARRWGFDRLAVVNLFAYRDTDPRELPTDDDAACGPDNTAALHAVVLRSTTVVAAWGAGARAERYRQKEQLRFAKPLFCIGRTNDNRPRHPLYVRKDAPLDVWLPAGDVDPVAG